MGTRLAPIDGSGLVARFRPQARRLDSLARHEPGLGHLIATALRHPRSPLSVLLPGIDVLESPGYSPALKLLWGLWRTTAPLVPDQAVRGWSFSTYEPPLGAAQGAELPSIVFRNEEHEWPDQHPVNYRTEVAVRPKSPDDAPTAEPVSAALATAFRTFEPGYLEHLLKRTAASWPELADRLTAIESAIARELSRRQPTS